MPWWTYALGAAAAASATAIFSKLAVAGIPPNLAAATRTLVALLFILTLVLATGEWGQARDVSARTWILLSMAGVATGLSWIFYFKAFQMAQAVQVAPIDKLSLPLTIVLAVLFLGESLNWKAGMGVALMSAGAWMTTLK